MNQHLYNEEDNKNLNAQIEQAIKPATEEVEVKGARGDNMAVNHIDELAFFPVGAEEVTSQKIQQSSAFGSHQKARSFTEGGIEAVNQATDFISPVTGKPHTFDVTPEMIRAAQEQCEAGGAVVLGGNGSTQMFSNIRDMFEKPTVTKRAFETFFVSGKGKANFDLDGTIFEPSPAVRLSPKSFEAKHLAQLEGYIYNNMQELDPEKLFAIIYLIGAIKEGHVPIKLVSGKHRIQLNKIVATMNTFFNKNYSVLTGIATMFSGMTQMPPQAETKE